MNNSQYIKALEKALKNLDKQSRKDIIMEIQSHIKEIGSQESLEVHFGSVDALAQSYLSGERTAEPMTTKVAVVSRKVLSWIGIAVLLIALGIGAAIWWWSGDEFNYANEDSPELTDKDINWKILVWDKPINIAIKQSKVVFYWHEEPTTKLNCKREILGGTENKQLEIRQNNCLVFMPNKKAIIKTDQSSIVLVRPIENVDINVEQSELQIAENSAKYQYNLRFNQSKTGVFTSYSDSALSISIDATQSSVSHYNYK